MDEVRNRSGFLRGPERLFPGLGRVLVTGGLAASTGSASQKKVRFERLVTFRMLSVFVFVISSACSSTDADLRNYSLLADTSSPMPFSTSQRLGLLRVRAFGTLDPGLRSHEHITDLALGTDDHLYLIGPSTRGVVRVDTTGRVLGRVGEIGTGPNGFLEPSSLVVMGDTVAVADVRLQQVKVLRTDGRLMSVFDVPPGVRYIEEGPSKTLIMTVAGDTAAAYMVDLSGRKLGAFFATRRRDVPKAENYEPAPPRVCAHEDVIVYANPWIYELAAFNLTDKRYLWIKRYQSEMISPISVKLGIIQRSVLVGLACTRDFIVLAYIDKKTSRVYYDFLDYRGQSRARLTFVRDEDALPGSLVWSGRDRLIALRGRPQQMVFLYAIRPT